jgi:FMN-dependent oxidoreductase (nitrilotriacetate monooxygenase family)
MGGDMHMEHDRRYDRADEFMEVVLGHWDSWEDGALVVDKKTGLFAHPEKVHRLDHAGAFFRSRGPFTVPRSAQGHPVIIQAGQSGRGQRFAGRWAELVFVAIHDIPRAKADYAAFKQAVAAAGRDPDKVRITMACYPVVAETRAEAEDKRALIDTLPNDYDRLSLLSEILNFDFARKGQDEAFTDDELEAMSGAQALRDRVIRASGKPHPTVRDFMQISGRGEFRDHPVFCGSPKDVADQMEEWFTAPACDGFVLAASHVPGTYEDLTRFLVPELQRRGLFRRDYEGATLRENLGLAVPAPGAWRR